MAAQGHHAWRHGTFHAHLREDSNGPTFEVNIPYMESFWDMKTIMINVDDDDDNVVVVDDDDDVVDDDDDVDDGDDDDVDDDDDVVLFCTYI